MQAQGSYKTATIIQYVKTSLHENGAILVKVPDEIFIRYCDDESYKGAFTRTGWYNTGAFGTASPQGIVVQMVQRDLTEENLIASRIKMILEGNCHYISLICLIGNGQNQTAILFPKTGFLLHPDYKITPLEGCFCPRDLQELGKCLAGCLNEANKEIAERFTKIKTFLIAKQ